MLYPESVASIVTLDEHNGKTYRDITKTVSVGLATVIKINNETESVEPKCDRKRKTARRDDHYLTRDSVNDPRKTSDV